MIEFLTSDQNLPFLVAYGFMLAFGLVTVLSGAFDHGHGDASPGHDVSNDVGGHGVDGHDVDGDLHGDLDHDGDIDLGDTILGFLGLGKAPITMLLVSFAWSFGSAGFIAQWISKLASGSLLSAGTASLIALVPALIVHSYVARGIGYFTAREDSTAIHSDTFVGKTATVVLGQTTKGRPTQAKLRDQHGQTHYLLIEPHRDEDTLNVGDEVVIVSRRGSLFEAMPTDIDLITAHLRAADQPKENA